MSRDKLVALEHLQNIDLQVEALIKDADAGPARVAALEAIAVKARATADLERGKVADNERARRHLEAQITDDKEKIKKWEARLPQLKHPREFAALEREVNGGKKAIEAAEEEMLQLEADLDPLKAGLQVKEAEANARDADLKKERTAVAAAQGGLQKQIAELQAARDRDRAEVDAPLYASYESIRKRRGGKVLVHMVNGICSGCNRKLAPQLVNRLLNGVVESCPSCVRLVYSPPSPPEAKAR